MLYKVTIKGDVTCRAKLQIKVMLHKGDDVKAKLQGGVT